VDPYRYPTDAEKQSPARTQDAALAIAVVAVGALALVTGFVLDRTFDAGLGSFLVLLGLMAFVRR
jgi:hypothetical protein